MSKYVKGKYKAVANEDSFHSLINLKHKIQWVAGLEQNNMIVTHSDLEAVDNSISEICLELKRWFEIKLESLELLEENNNEH